MYDFLQRVWQGNTVQDWLISLAIVVITALLSKGVYRIFCFFLTKITARTSTAFDDLLVQKVRLPAMVLMILLGIRFALERLTFSESIETAVNKGFIIAIILNVTWIVIQLMQSGMEGYIKRDTPRSKQVLSFLERFTTIIIGGIGLVVALNNAGFDVAALIAGLGIGGVALALAAQDTVKNIFGGVVVFVERPFRVGDQIKVRDIEGYVEEIRMRSTRLKGLNGQLIHVPNAIFSDSPITKIITHPPAKLNIPISLSPKNSSEKIDRAFQLMQQIADKNLNGKPAIIYFDKVNGTSFDIKLDGPLPDGSDLRQLQTQILKQIVQNFKANEIDFA